MYKPDFFPEAFLTGSRAYGKPGKGSDVDLVVFTDLATASRLLDMADNSEGLKNLEEAGYSSRSLRFGSLNLLVTTDENEYKAWQEGTALLVARKARTNKPVSRTKAVDTFNDFRFLHGVSDK